MSLVLTPELPRFVIQIAATGPRRVIIYKQKGDAKGLLFHENGAIIPLSRTERENYMSADRWESKYETCCGILGMISVPIEAEPKMMRALALLTRKKQLGHDYEAHYFEVTEVNFVSITRLPLGASETAICQEIRDYLVQQSFFAIPINENAAFDITVSKQKASNGIKSENKFHWNLPMTQPFEDAGVNSSEWLLKIICGAVILKECFIRNILVRLCIISRMSCERAGTRFQTRGCDSLGNVANSTETEQKLCFQDGQVFAFTMIRGSVPLYWTQRGIQLSHKIKFTSSDASFQIKQHLSAIEAEYGRCIIVNLLGSGEGEATLSDKFQEELHNAGYGERYIEYDYHKKNKGPTAEVHSNHEALKNELAARAHDFGFFMGNVLTPGVAPTRLQTGIFRVNCVDCLDRTNRIQSMIGDNALEQWMTMVAIDASIRVRLKDDLSRLWTANGNCISQLYTGTDAMHTHNSSKLENVIKSGQRVIHTTNTDGDSRQLAIEALVQPLEAMSELRDKIRTYIHPLAHRYLPLTICRDLVLRFPAYTSNSPLRVGCATWNVNGKVPLDLRLPRENLADWLFAPQRRAAAKRKKNESAILVQDVNDNNDFIEANQSDDNDARVDVMCVGLQEMVVLDGKAIGKDIIGVDDKKRRADWEAALIKCFAQSHDFDSPNCPIFDPAETNFDRVTSQAGSDPLVFLTSQQLVGVCGFLFVRKSLLPHVKEVSMARVKTGGGGQVGNKGGVALRLVVHSTSMAFVVAHLAAGQKDVAERNKNWNDVMREMRWTPDSQFQGRNIYTHDYIFWLGDFNYRIQDTTFADTVNAFAPLVKKHGPLGLRVEAPAESEEVLKRYTAHDQLFRERGSGNAFRVPRAGLPGAFTYFREQRLDFPPTYKYDAGLDIFESNKSRIPSWTDRVLWYRKSMQVSPDLANATDFTPGRGIFYCSVESIRVSDHRPVFAMFEIDIHRQNPESLHQEALRRLNDFGPRDCTITLEGVPLTDPKARNLFETMISELPDRLDFPYVVLRYKSDASVHLTLPDPPTALTLSKHIGGEEAWSAFFERTVIGPSYSPPETWNWLGIESETSSFRPANPPPRPRPPPPTRKPPQPSDHASVNPIITGSAPKVFEHSRKRRSTRMPQQDVTWLHIDEDPLLVEYRNSGGGEALADLWSNDAPTRPSTAPRRPVEVDDLLGSTTPPAPARPGTAPPAASSSTFYVEPPLPGVDEELNVVDQSLDSENPFACVLPPVIRVLSPAVVRKPPPPSRPAPVSENFFDQLTEIQPQAAPVPPKKPPPPSRPPPVASRPPPPPVVATQSSWTPLDNNLFDDVGGLEDAGDVDDAASLTSSTCQAPPFQHSLITPTRTYHHGRINDSSLFSSRPLKPCVIPPKVAPRIHHHPNTELGANKQVDDLIAFDDDEDDDFDFGDDDADECASNDSGPPPASLPPPPPPPSFAPPPIPQRQGPPPPPPRRV